MDSGKADKKSKAYHEAGHTIAARHLGFPVKSTTIEDTAIPGHMTDTFHLRDYFDENYLHLGRLKRKGKAKLERADLRLFYALLLQSLAGYAAVELAGFDMKAVRNNHYEEDRVLALNVLKSLELSRVSERHEKMLENARKLLRKRWHDVEVLVVMLMREGTVRFNYTEQKGNIEII